MTTSLISRRNILGASLAISSCSSRISFAYEGINDSTEFFLANHIDLHSTDHTKELQNCIDQCSKLGLMLVAPKESTFFISASLKIPSNFSADFNNSVITRIPGTVFNMIENINFRDGNSSIHIRNLKLDGNLSSDGRNAVRPEDRFGGIIFVGVHDCTLKRVTVNATVNAEDGRAAIYFRKCTNILAFNIGGSRNDRSCILIDRSSIKIFGSYTSNNKGSGITSIGADDTEYFDCVAIGNGYSQISINGIRSRANNLYASHGAKGYSGVNIGHDVEFGRSHDSVISNVYCVENSGWGVTVAGSKSIELKNIISMKNLDHNLMVFKNSYDIEIDQATFCNSINGCGLYIYGGSGHSVSRTRSFSNSSHGISVVQAFNIAISRDVRLLNNGQSKIAGAGLDLQEVNSSRFEVECFDDQQKKTQEFGISLSKSYDNTLSVCAYANAVRDVRESSSFRNVIRYLCS